MLLVCFFGPGCLAPGCSFCCRAFLLPFLLVFSLLLSLFGPGWWAPCCSFCRRAFFVAVLACVFSSFAVFFFFQKESDSFIFDFFFLVLFVFPLTFHNGQIAEKPFLSF